MSRTGASPAGFSLHAATCAGAMDPKAREALLKYVLRPPIAQERVVQGPDGLVRYRSWAELLNTLGIDALTCAKCQGRMKVLSLVRESDEVRRYLHAIGEPTEPPERAPARGPPFWASRALRISAGHEAA